jgi:hypothetical protein
MKWRYFLAAAFSVSTILIVNGVPYLPVLAGCGAVAFWNARKKGNDGETGLIGRLRRSLRRIATSRLS